MPQLLLSFLNTGKWLLVLQHFTIISNKPLKIQAEFTLEEGGDYLK
jgi:hypothetical protein